MSAEVDVPTIDGYVSDTAYPSNFHAAFQSEWTDWNMLRRRLRPPRANGAPFCLIDLGCGDGLGLIVAAAAHPQARFIGVDAMPVHIERGRRIAKAAGIDNVILHCAEFADASPLATGDADYVTAQGVLAWVSSANRECLLDLAAAWLKPGGALTLGYNCLPGWSQMAGFQKLVRATAKHLEGDSGERFEAALARLRAADLFPQSLWDWFDPIRENTPASYFAHEYLNAHWAPCWSGDVIAALAGRGLDFIGQATPSRLREDLSFEAEWCKSLADMPDTISRELAADVLTNNWYRQDIYVKRPAVAAEDAAWLDELLACWWMLPSPLRDGEFRATTMAGELRFDNAAARAIVARLAEGPAQLAAIENMAAPDLVNVIDALYTARVVLPAAPASVVAAEAINRTLLAQDQAIHAIVTPHGAVAIDRSAVKDLTSADLRRLGLSSA